MFSPPPCATQTHPTSDYEATPLLRQVCEGGATAQGEEGGGLYGRPPTQCRGGPTHGSQMSTRMYSDGNVLRFRVFFVLGVDKKFPTPPRAIAHRIGILAHTSLEGFTVHTVKSSCEIEFVVISSIRPERRLESQSSATVAGEIRTCVAGRLSALDRSTVRLIELLSS